MKARQLLAYMTLALLWGLSYLVILRVVAAFGWVGGVSFRALVAGGTLYLLARVVGRKLVFNVGWLSFAVVGATTVVGQLVGLNLAIPRIGTAMSSIFVAAMPLFSMIIGRIWGIEQIRYSGLAGLMLGFCGMVMLVGFPARPVDGTFVFGCCCGLLSSFSAAFGSNYVSVKLKNTGPWESTIGAFLAGGVMTLPLLFLVPVPTVPAPGDYLWLLFLGCAMSALAYILYFRLVQEIGPTRAISVEFLVTVVAVSVGTIFLGERMSLVQLGGAVVIMLGCGLVLGLVPIGRGSSRT